MKMLLLLIGKLINNVFGYAKQKHVYFASWKYLYNISLMGMGRIQGNPIEADGELEVIKKVITESGNDIILFDVGANKGDYSNHVMQRVTAGKKMSIHIFEPSSVHANALKKLFNGSVYPGHQFFINQAALCHTESFAYLYADSEGSDLGSLINLKNAIRPFDENKKEKVETLTIDGYMARHDIERIDFIKIDVEGGEFNVLSGASKAISEKRIKRIQFEFGAGNITARVFFHDFWEMLSDKYSFYQVLSGGLVPIEAYSPDLEIFKTTNFYLSLK